MPKGLSSLGQDFAYAVSEEVKDLLFLPCISCCLSKYGSKEVGTVPFFRNKPRMQIME
jgi:hypothetical protein